jgi:predicted nucleic acid-binding protein
VILADSSAWIEFDRATGSHVDRRMTTLVDEGTHLAVSEPIVMEVTAGARSDRAASRLRDLLLSFPLLTVDPAADFDAAARIYRRCRSAGVTPRGMVDCLIASVAWRRGASILAQDANLRRIAIVMGVALDATSDPM